METVLLWLILIVHIGIMLINAVAVCVIERYLNVIINDLAQKG